MKKFYLLVVILFSSMSSPPESSWAHKTLQQMSPEEKIGQLFLIAAYVDPDFASKEIGNPGIIQEIDRYITAYHVGGLAYVGPSQVAKQVALTNHYQELSKYPLLVAQDLEWGLSMRIQEGVRFPKNSTLGVLENNELIYEMGKEIGREAKLIGVHMNLSPVLDVNVNPDNIVINVRSFGSSPEQVAKKGIAMIRGLQDAGIIASAKHFPGLGDISTDPHLGLPSSSHGKDRLTQVELYPFAQAIAAGVLSIQTEHLLVPALEPAPMTPASLSPRMVDGLLKQQMGFKGLVVSGALRMKALANHFSGEEIAVRAFLAGSDMLLMPQDFPKAYEAIKQALADGKITMQQVDERVLKILEMKELVHLDQNKLVAVLAVDELSSSYAKGLKKQLYQSAVSLVRNEHQLVPLSSQDRVAYVQLGDAPTSQFPDFLRSFLSVDVFAEADEEQFLQKIAGYSKIVLAIYPADPRRIQNIRLLDEKKLQEQLKQFRVHGISDSMKRVINVLQPHEKKVVVAYFGNPFGLHFLDAYSTLVMGFEPVPETEEMVAQLCNR